MTFFRRSFLIVLMALILVNPASMHSARQKRGIMKMMMHIMWDPVRLIRYWYAYDVSKEIAKSWRKIIPTLMVLPLNSNPSATPGIAKYVHPTHGLKENVRHKQVKQFAYPDLPSGETYQFQDVVSAEHVDGVYSVPELHHRIPTKVVSSFDALPLSVSDLSKPGETNHYLPYAYLSPQIDNKDTSQFVWQSVHDSSTDDNTHLQVIPQDSIQGILGIKPHKVSSNSKEDNHYFIKSSSDNTVSFPSVSSQSLGKYPDQLGSIPYKIVVKSPSYGAESKYHHFPIDPETDDSPQEIHIVLHPIPVEDPKQAYQQAKDKHGPIVAESSQQKHPPTMQSLPLRFSSYQYELKEKFNGDLNKTRSERQGNSTANPFKNETNKKNRRKPSQSARIKWKFHSSKLGNSTHDNYTDHISEQSVVRIKSLDIKSGKDINELTKLRKNTNLRHPPLSNTYGINISRLKEDLKHGTPVLIPFNNKNEPMSGNVELNTRTNSENHKHTQANFSNTLNNGVLNQKQTLPVTNSLKLNELNPNSTQRIVLFTANKKVGK